MAKRSGLDVDDDEDSNDMKKQRMDEMALVTLPGSLELTASGDVRKKESKNILQSSTVLLTGHTEAIYSVAFDPSGMHLASASLDRSISKSIPVVPKIFRQCEDNNPMSLSCSRDE